MIAAAFIIVSMWVAGIPLARAVHPTASRLAMVGEAWLLACGWIGCVMFVLSMSNVAWTPVVCASAVLLPLALIAPFAFGSRRAAEGDDSAVLHHRHTLLAAWLVDVLTAVVMTGYSIFATLSPMWAWDFWAIWGLKSRTFFEHRGIDWAFLTRGDNAFVHPDYPVFIPLLQDFFSLMRGGWDDQWMGLLYAAFGIAILAIVRGSLMDESRSPLVAAVATLSMSGIAISSWVGMAEGPLIAYIGAAVLLARKGLRKENAALVRAGAVMAGLAACTKNEGLTFVVALIIGAAVSNRGNYKLLFNLFPAVVLPLPWMVVERLYQLHSYFEGGSLLDRVVGRLAHPQEVLSALAANVPNRPLFWIAAVGTVLLLLPRAVRYERFALVTLAVQVLFYVGAFIATPYSVRWHVETSWVRLLNQLAVPLMFVAIALLLPLLNIREEEEAK